MKAYFKELLEYSHYYNLEIIKKFNDGDLHFMVPDRAIALLSHTLNAHKIWNNRLAGKEDTVDIWKNLEVDQLEAAENENFQETMSLLDNEDIERVVKYKNSKGESYENSVRDIIFHVVNHSTYHRGQIATEFRKEGIDPIVSDFVFYKRDK
ncbi:MAG: DinB family protein [Christiangramia sp.]